MAGVFFTKICCQASRKEYIKLRARDHFAKQDSLTFVALLTYLVQLSFMQKFVVVSQVSHPYDIVIDKNIYDSYDVCG